MEEWKYGSLETLKLKTANCQPPTANYQSFLASKVKPIDVPTSGVLRT
jgi:hypothetical protein